MAKQQLHQPFEAYDDTRSNSDLEDSNLLNSGLKKKGRNRCREFVIRLGGIFLVVVYSLAIIGVAYRAGEKSRSHGARFLNTFGGEYLSYEARIFDGWESLAPEAQFFAEPSEYVNKNWHELLEYGNVRVPPKVMKQLGQVDEGVQLPDGSYYGTLTVFHHLHCLKNVYHALYPEYYNLTNMTPDDEKEEQSHIYAVMCQGDLSLTTMTWRDTSLKPFVLFPDQHECVNWDRVVEMAIANSFNPFADGVLVNPYLGPVYKNEELVEETS